MARLLASFVRSVIEEEDDLGDVDGVDEELLAEGTTVVTDKLAAAGAGVAAGLHSHAELLTNDDLLQEQQHATVHAFHQHIPRNARHSGSAAGIIWLLILLHLAFIAYWGWIWWRQRGQREVAARKASVPQKVNCVYDWTPVIPQISNMNMQLANKSAQH